MLISVGGLLAFPVYLAITQLGDFPDRLAGMHAESLVDARLQHFLIEGLDHEVIGPKFQAEAFGLRFGL